MYNINHAFEVHTYGVYRKACSAILTLTFINIFTGIDDYYSGPYNVTIPKWYIEDTFVLILL